MLRNNKAIWKVKKKNKWLQIHNELLFRLSWDFISAGFHVHIFAYFFPSKRTITDSFLHWGSGAATQGAVWTKSAQRLLGFHSFRLDGSKGRWSRNWDIGSSKGNCLVDTKCSGVSGNSSVTWQNLGFQPSRQDKSSYMRVYKSSSAFYAW